MQVKCITIQKEIADLSAEAASLDRIARISELLDNWDNISFEDRREVADGMISQIKATNEDFDIVWKIQFFYVVFVPLSINVILSD